MMSARTLPGGAASLLAALLLALAGTTLLAGCVPAVVAVGAGATALVVTDRRTTGAQADDQAIEFRVLTSAGSSWGNEVHLNVTSYNGRVLLTGEAPTAAIRDEITQIARGAERVRSVTNEMLVGPTVGLQGRTNDTYLTSLVKSRFVEGSQQFSATQVKVVTERSVVYLMGIVTREEGDAAAQIAATTAGVARVVKLFEYMN
jgi:osmotically-inducible protein OsmY